MTSSTFLSTFQEVDSRQPNALHLGPKKWKENGIGVVSTSAEPVKAPEG